MYCNISMQLKFSLQTYFIIINIIKIIINTRWYLSKFDDKHDKTLIRTSR